MKKVIVLFALILLATFCQSFATHADEPKQKIKTLSKEESEKALKIARDVYEAQTAINQAVNQSLAVPLDDCSKVTAAVAQMRIISERLNGAIARQNDLRESQRKAHDMEGGDWTPDYKSLVQSQQPPSN